MLPKISACVDRRRRDGNDSAVELLLPVHFSYFNTPPKTKRLTKYLHTPQIRVGPIIMPFKIKRRMLWFHDNEKDMKPEIILYPVYKHVTEVIEISDFSLVLNYV